MEQLDPGCLKRYGIFLEEPLERLRGGYANWNFKVDAPRGKYVLRVYREQSEEEIAWELRVLDWLHGEDFPVAPVVVTEDGSQTIRIDEGVGALFPLIEGRHPNVSEEHAQEMGEVLGWLHSLPGFNAGPRASPYSIAKCDTLISRFGSAKHQYPELFIYFREETDALREPLDRDLPSGFIHGDVFPDNVIFKGGKLRAMIDFEDACIGPYLFDIGSAINGFCFVNNELDLHLYKAFFEGYERQRPLYPEERGLLHYYIRWGAHAYVSWHLSHIMDHPDPAKQTRAEELARRVVIFRDMPD